MSQSFSKLFSSITASTVWQEPNATRIVWVTMLAMCDAKGRVMASVPGLANIARVTIDECVEAIDRFIKPDKWSRTKAHEGRRIEEIEGGWRLLNYDYYRQARDTDDRREYQREWDRAHRGRNPTNPTDLRHNRPNTTQAEAEAEVDKRKDSDADASLVAEPGDRKRIPDCPHQEILKLYHEILPELPQVLNWTPARQAQLQARWRERENRQSLETWKRYFTYVRDCKFLMGQVDAQNGRKRFIADLEWLTKAANFTKVVEGKYHPDGTPITAVTFEAVAA